MFEWYWLLGALLLGFLLASAGWMMVDSYTMRRIDVAAELLRTAETELELCSVECARQKAGTWRLVSALREIADGSVFSDVVAQNALKRWKP